MKKLHCCVGCCAGQCKPRSVCRSEFERAVCRAKKYELGFLHPHLVEAAGLNDGQVRDVVLLEAAGTVALLDHDGLKKTRGGKERNWKNESTKRAKIRERLPQNSYKYPTLTHAEPFTAASTSQHSKLTPETKHDTYLYMEKADIA